MCVHVLSVTLGITCQLVQQPVSLVLHQDALSVQTMSALNASTLDSCQLVRVVLAPWPTVCTSQLVQLVRHAWTDFIWVLTTCVTLASTTALNAPADLYAQNVTLVTTSIPMLV